MSLAASLLWSLKLFQLLSEWLNCPKMLWLALLKVVNNESPTLLISFIFNWSKSSVSSNPLANLNTKVINISDVFIFVLCTYWFCPAVCSFSRLKTLVDKCRNPFGSLIWQKVNNDSFLSFIFWSNYSFVHSKWITNLSLHRQYSNTTLFNFITHSLRSLDFTWIIYYFITCTIIGHYWICVRRIFR